MRPSAKRRLVFMTWTSHSAGISPGVILKHLRKHSRCQVYQFFDLISTGFKQSSPANYFQHPHDMKYLFLS
ncbi:hypothetical protein EDD21DRAFT_381405 [Dissophora ornata]|nr:hypothetical protein EDD21DRAFT_381405 [Dissophora ornata]